MTFDLQLPVSISVQGTEGDNSGGFTELISSNDVVFLSPQRFRAGQRIHLSLSMGRALDSNAEAECRGTVTESQAVEGLRGPMFRTSASFLRSPRIVKTSRNSLNTNGWMAREAPTIPVA